MRLVYRGSGQKIIVWFIQQSLRKSSVLFKRNIKQSRKPQLYKKRLNVKQVYRGNRSKSALTMRLNSKSNFFWKSSRTKMKMRQRILEKASKPFLIIPKSCSKKNQRKKFQRKLVLRGSISRRCVNKRLRMKFKLF